LDRLDEGLDRKIVLRSDGTRYDSGYWYCYSTCERFSEIGGMVYTVGNEQDYHFKVLFLILKNWVWSDSLYIIYHTWNGRSTFRKERTVVDADDLMQEMIDTAQNCRRFRKVRQLFC
jgi:arginyl-tRNA synthetase